MMGKFLLAFLVILSAILCVVYFRIEGKAEDAAVSRGPGYVTLIIRTRV